MMSAPARRPMPSTISRTCHGDVTFSGICTRSPATRYGRRISGGLPPGAAGADAGVALAESWALAYLVHMMLRRAGSLAPAAGRAAPW